MASGKAPPGEVIISNDALLIATLMVIVCDGELPSPAWMVNVKLPVAVGVPLNVPFEFNVKPPGNWPLASVQAMGVIPPLDWNVKLYGTPIMASGNAPGTVVIVSAVAILMVKVTLAS